MKVGERDRNGKNYSAPYLTPLRSEPVAIQRTGRPVAVLLSWEEYEAANGAGGRVLGPAGRGRGEGGRARLLSEAAMAFIRDKMNETA